MLMMARKAALAALAVTCLVTVVQASSECPAAPGCSADCPCPKKGCQSSVCAPVDGQDKKFECLYQDIHCPGLPSELERFERCLDPTCKGTDDGCSYCKYALNMDEYYKDSTSDCICKWCAENPDKWDFPKCQDYKHKCMGCEGCNNAKLAFPSLRNVLKFPNIDYNDFRVDKPWIDASKEDENKVLCATDQQEMKWCNQPSDGVDPQWWSLDTGTKCIPCKSIRDDPEKYGLWDGPNWCRLFYGNDGKIFSQTFQPQYPKSQRDAYCSIAKLVCGNKVTVPLKCDGTAGDGGSNCQGKNLATCFEFSCMHADEECAEPKVKTWSQCGGQGYDGPTKCEQGSSCVKQNNWYSQCVPQNRKLEEFEMDVPPEEVIAAQEGSPSARRSLRGAKN
jgi:hypothetical protein